MFGKYIDYRRRKYRFDEERSMRGILEIVHDLAGRAASHNNAASGANAVTLLDNVTQQANHFGCLGRHRGRGRSDNAPSRGVPLQSGA